MWYVIDKESHIVVSRSYSFYVANKVRSEYDGAVILIHR
jgi:hypothetical protein